LRLPCAEIMDAKAISNRATEQTRSMLFMSDFSSRGAEAQ
jgi:hypothetical protein